MSGVKSFLDDGPPAGGGKRDARNEMDCPSCGLRQELALDCVGCGAIIDRVPAKAAAAPAAAEAAPGPPGELVAAPTPEDSPPTEEEAMAVGGDLYQGANPFAEDGAHRNGARREQHDADDHPHVSDTGNDVDQVEPPHLTGETKR